MALPATDFPNWASTTNYTTGPDVGTPTKVAPSAGEIAEGFVAQTAVVPQHFNYLWSIVKSHIAYLRGLVAENLTWTGVQTFNTAPVLSNAVDMTYSAAKSFTVMYMPNGDFSTTDPANVEATVGGGLQVNITAGVSSSGTYQIPIRLPIGATLTGWRAIGLQNFFSVALATCDLTFAKRDVDYTADTMGAVTTITTQSITGNNVVWKKTWSGSETVTAGKLMWLEFTVNGVGGGGSNVLSGFSGLELTYTDTKAIGSRQ